MESRNVKIGISAKQSEGDGVFAGDPVTMNIICEGIITEDDGKISIEYEENLSGEGITHTKLAFEKGKPEVLSMIRSGEVTASWVFSKGERCSCRYTTDVITLDFCMVTESIRNTISLSGGSINLHYNMEVRGITVSRNEYKLTVIS